MLPLTVRCLHVVMLVLIVLASPRCGDREDDGLVEPDPTTSSTLGTTAAASTASPTESDSVPVGDSTAALADLGVPGDLGNGEGAMCNLFEQDCARGLKCAYACDGPVCAPSCRPVSGDGQAGDPCTAYGLEADSPDDCGPDTLCWTGEAEAGRGVCTPFCQGSAAAPACADPQRVCAQQTVCLPRCDPLLQACPAGQGCFDVDFGAFVCWNAADVPIPHGSECAGNTLCVPGSTCVFASSLPQCDGPRCCTPHCDLGATDPCPAIDPALQCVPYGTDIPEQLDIGVCILPS